MTSPPSSRGLLADLYDCLTGPRDTCDYRETGIRYNSGPVLLSSDSTGGSTCRASAGNKPLRIQSSYRCQAHEPVLELYDRGRGPLSYIPTFSYICDTIDHIANVVNGKSAIPSVTTRRHLPLPAVPLRLASMGIQYILANRLANPQCVSRSSYRLDVCFKKCYYEVETKRNLSSVRNGASTDCYLSTLQS